MSKPPAGSDWSPWPDIKDTDWKGWLLSGKGFMHAEFMESLAYLHGKYRLVGLVVMASASRAEDPEFKSPLAPRFFRGRVIPVT